MFLFFFIFEGIFFKKFLFFKGLFCELIDVFVCYILKCVYYGWIFGNEVILDGVMIFECVGCR